MDEYWKDIQHLVLSWERLENKECLQQYSNVFIFGRRNVLLVSSTKNSANSVLMYGDTDLTLGMDNNWWLCSETGKYDGSMTCNPENYLSTANNWTVFDYPVEYCLSETTKDICSVNFSMTIMTVVLGFNALKVVLMFWVLFRFDAEKILTSVGDAASSFLTYEDPTTMQMCLADKRDI